ncbi:MAG: ABC transporter permease, partial [Pseudomonadales bacterium]|nr:ABC transporter permease [Pseudomonadales bacterium]
TALIGILFLGLFISAVSGLYPAFYLSSISPKLAITNFGRLGKTRSSFRQFLIFVQLFISIGVIASTLLMTEQIQFVANKPLGFEKDNRVLIELQGLDVIENLETIRNELLDDSNVIDMAQINQIPGVENVSWIAPTENKDGLFESRELDRIEVGYNFIQAMGVELVAGRDFSEEVTTDRDSAIIVNEALVDEMQWDDPIGKQIGYENFRKTVIGVTRDFHYGPLHNEIRPLHIAPVSNNFSNTSTIQRSLEVRSIVVRITGDNTSAALRHIESTLRRFDPAHVFDPVFLSDSLDELYESETNLLKLTGVFAAICIAISAMGLLGLAAFTTEQRFKEIGIRKTLGATSAQIVTLLTRNLLPLVALASIPSSFIAYIAIDIWLEKFAYQEDISLLPFIVAISVVAAVAFSTVALQSLKAAQSNPIETLKYE